MKFSVEELAQLHALLKEEIYELGKEANTMKDALSLYQWWLLAHGALAYHCRILGFIHDPEKVMKLDTVAREWFCEMLSPRHESIIRTFFEQADAKEQKKKESPEQSWKNFLRNNRN